MQEIETTTPAVRGQSAQMVWDTPDEAFQLSTEGNYYAKDMAKFGFGLCAPKKNGHEFMSATYPRECKQWVIAADDVLAGRKAWLEKRESDRG